MRFRIPVCSCSFLRPVAVRSSINNGVNSQFTSALLLSRFTSAHGLNTVNEHITPPHIPSLPSAISKPKLGSDAQKYFSDDDDNTSSHSSGGGDSASNSLALRLRDAALSHVPVLGWTHAAVAAAAADLGLSAQSAGESLLHCYSFAVIFSICEIARSF